MHLKRRDLWGIIAVGEIFSAGGMLCFISFHWTIFANPALIFSFVSSCRHLSAIGSLAEMCGPLLRAAMIWCFGQLGPHWMGQPCVLYS